MYLSPGELGKKRKVWKTTVHPEIWPNLRYHRINKNPIYRPSGKGKWPGFQGPGLRQRTPGGWASKILLVHQWFHCATDRAQSMCVAGRLLPAASHLWDPCNRPHMPRTQVSSSKPSPTGKPHDPVGPVILLLFLPSRRSECTCSRLHSEKWLIPEPLTTGISC